MKKGLFLMRPAHGHVNPTIGVVNELLKKGHEITYICGEEFRDKFKDTNVKFIGFTNILNKTTVKGIEGTTLDRLGKNLEINEIELELAMKEEGNFDYVVVDQFINPGTKLIEKFNIKKTITSITTFALNSDIIYDMEKSFERVTNAIEKMQANLENVRTKYDEVGEKFGINFSTNPVANLVSFNSDLKIVFTSKLFQPYSNNFDESYQFVGPSIFNRADFEKFELKNKGNKKLLYISLGTISNENKEFYQNCFKALKEKKDLNVIISIGNKLTVEELGDIPSNFEIYNYVPQLEVLKKVDLFITHGGMNSTSEALYNNVPLIVIPQASDQALVAKRVENLGTGIALINKTDSNSIQKAVNTILMDNSYKENAIKIGESLRAHSGHMEAASLIDNII
ncbi:MAG: macrolide family glycosyltransferase [Clostridium sp.]|uniref:macrolide family glycosyltransferase n=1 Tax=Clostridium sp. TaxID=1506 RepID=UPI003EE4B44D